MNASQLFKAAHALTKKIRRAGDDYRITFGACLRHIMQFGVPAMSDTLIALQKKIALLNWAGEFMCAANPAAEIGMSSSEVAANGDAKILEKLFEAAEFVENVLDDCRNRVKVDRGIYDLTMDDGVVIRYTEKGFYRHAEIIG